MVVVVVVSVVDGLPLGLVVVVLVSVFCSHAASNAAPARMQMYFFIVLVLRTQPEFNVESEQATILVLREFLKRRVVFHPMRVRHRLTGEFALACVDAAGERRIFFARAFETVIGEELNITKGDIR